MGEPTAYYVDPSIAASSGSGTIGDPYGDLQHALDTVTRDASDGDIFHIKAGTDEVLSSALSLATYGTPDFGAPLLFQGYTSTAGDGGIGEISGNGSVAVLAGSPAAVLFKDMHLHNCGAAAILTLGAYCRVVDCELDNTTGNGIVIAQYGAVMGCNIHNIGGIGVSVVNEMTHVGHNYFTNGTNDFAHCCKATQQAVQFYNNICSVDGATIGFETTQFLGGVHNNSFLSSGTGKGIYLSNGSNGLLMVQVTNNLVDGFDKGIHNAGTAGNVCFLSHNSVYNATTADFDLGAHAAFDFENETLGATPFAKSGSDNYANRATYFAPADTGEVLTPYGGMAYARGAIQTAGSGSSGGGPFVMRRSGLHLRM